ncbi:Ribosomal large subunit pseudouridine synthase C [Chitinispirillum alkaliphilum]|nr:Ribosomal large subunit pseudouridine synthase C [Chitinispirillum alkaliphilum]
MIEYKAGPDETGSRLDRFLRKKMPLMGLSDIYALIRKGRVLVDSNKAKANHRLKEGELLQIRANPSEFSTDEKNSSLADLVNTEFFKHNFKILFEDSAILVCNKPCGLVVHPGSGHLKHDNLIDLASAYMLSKNHEQAPVLTHRLDRDTSGIILLAKNKGIVRKLHQSMISGKFTKQYLAISHNRPPKTEGRVSLGMKRTHDSSGMKMKIAEKGDHSESSYRLTEYRNELSSLEIILHTGKTHQIRVHMAHLLAPIVGDVRYGRKDLDQKLFSSRKNLPPRLYLHAHKLSFPHPLNSKKITLKADIPAEFRKIMN